MPNIQETVQNFVQNGKLEKALDALLEWAAAQQNSDVHDTVMLLKSNFSAAKRQEMNGLITNAEMMQQRAKTAHALLAVTREIDSGNPPPPPTPPPPITSDNKILFLGSNPKQTAQLQLEKEFSAVFSSLQQFNAAQLRLASAWAVTVPLLQEAMLRHRPSIVHFAGHGTQNEEGSSIILQEADGSAFEVPPAALTNLFRLFATRFPIKAVVLNACYSEAQARAIAAHVPFVIGMNTAIGDEAAIAFSRTFYMTLASENDDVRFAFDLAVNSLAMYALDDANVPVLYG